MFDVYSCIKNDHDLRLVGLAGVICIATEVAIVLLLRQARDAQLGDRPRCLVAAGTVSGFGVWATHFIAMIGFDPGIIIGYALGPTLLSLCVAVGATTIAYGMAIRSRALAHRLMAGVTLGFGISSMHYIGMYAIEVSADLRWSATYVVASIILAILPTPFILRLTIDRRGWTSALGAATLILSGILALHFTGMAALTLIPHRIETPASVFLLSSPQMGVFTAIVAFGLIVMSIMTVRSSGRMRRAVDASEREFNILVQGISDYAIYMLDEAGRVVTWNDGAQRLKGYARGEALGLHLSAFFSPEDRAAELPNRAIATARSEGKFNTEGWRYRKDGSRFWAHVTIEPVRDACGVFYGFAKITRDMTRFKEDQDRLSTLTSNLDAALSHMHQGLCLFGPDERLILSNVRVGSIFGVSMAECPPGTTFERVFQVGLEKRAGGAVAPGLLDEVLSRHRACIASETGGTLLVPFTDDCTLSISHHPITGGGWVSTFDDVSERRRAERRIEHMALHDGLTNLPNRINYSEQLDSEITKAREDGGSIGVIGIDLDRFKEVNDLHGHATGDAVLRILADRMQDRSKPGEVVARIGGDEFAAFKAFRNRADLVDFIDRLNDCLAMSIEIDEKSIYPGASLGVAIYPTDGIAREQVVNNADLAMYRAKAMPGRQVCFYEQGMDEAARVRRTIANDLREAIARDELSIAYQVQKSVTTEKVVGYEALLRWHHPREGWVSPAEFIPIAEESGGIVEIGEWVLRQACIEAARWPEPWRVAVNLSPVQLMQTDLLRTVASALIESGLPAKRLELEITETAFIADKVRALHILRQIKALGVMIAIDDFGTGYSSLDTLNSFPFDKIKIDRSFLINSETSHQARAIIRAVLALGHSLDVPVLAEGLESEDQLKLLRDEGCDEAQGYLWGRPVVLPRIEAAPVPTVAEAA